MPRESSESDSVLETALRARLSSIRAELAEKGVHSGVKVITKLEMQINIILGKLERELRDEEKSRGR